MHNRALCSHRKNKYRNLQQHNIHVHPSTHAGQLSLCERGQNEDLTFLSFLNKLLLMCSSPTEISLRLPSSVSKHRVDEDLEYVQLALRSSNCFISKSMNIVRILLLPCLMLSSVTNTISLSWVPMPLPPTYPWGWWHICFRTLTNWPHTSC